MNRTGLSERDLALDAASPGMTLAAAVLDASGGVLVAQDAVLTESLLAALRRRGVQRCVVWGIDDPDGVALAQQRERALARLALLFRHTTSVEGSALLLAQLCAYRAGQAP